MITLSQKCLLACLLLVSAGSLQAQSLPRPAAIEPAIDFWTQIYTEIPVDQGLIHDSERNLRVLGQIDVAAPGQWQRRRTQVRAALERYRDALHALAEQDGRPRTALQQQLTQRLPPNLDAEAMVALAERLRFQGGLRERFRDSLERSGHWRDHMRAVFTRHEIPLELLALPHVESSFNPKARSHAGAAGLWQFTVGTGRRFMRIDPVVDERLDPWRSTEAAAELLAYNYAQIGHWPLAITAYNHGLNGMRRAVKTVGGSDYVRIYREYEGRQFGFASRNFYPSLLAAAGVDANAERYFPGVKRSPAWQAKTIALPHFTPVATLLDAPGIDAETLQRLNMALGPAVWDGRKFIPRGYRLRVPGDAAPDWAQTLSQLPGSQLYQAQRPDVAHAIVAGDTLSTIAERYAVSVEALMARNNIADAHRIRAGQTLDLPVAGAMPRPVGGQRYEVQPGDTLGAIAQNHGIDQQRLAELNQIDNPDRLRVGQRLLIDSASAVAVVETASEP